MISNIQILRAISAVIIVLFHIVVSARSYDLETSIFYKIDIWGPASVDIFFIISGFIMVYIQHKKKRTARQFIQDRIERVIPLYWIVTVFMSLLLLISSQPITSELFIQSMLFYNYTIFQEMPVLYVGWTLEYEMLFYLLFGLSLFLNSPKLSFLLSTIALGSLALLGLHSVILDFLYGMLAAHIFIKFKTSIKPIFSLMLIFLGILLLTVEWPIELARNIYAGIPALIIFMGFLYLPPIKSKLFNLLGDASYSIYLIQVVSIPVLYKVFQLIPLKNISYLPEFYAILCLAFTCLAGVILHFTIEKPVANLIRNLKKQKKQIEVTVNS